MSWYFNHNGSKALPGKDFSFSADAEHAVTSPREFIMAIINGKPASLRYSGEMSDLKAKCREGNREVLNWTGFSVDFIYRRGIDRVRDFLAS